MFVGGSIDAGPQVRTLNRYDIDDPHHTFDAFPDDEAIFSAMDSNGQDVLIGDNNAFSGLGNRVVHLNANWRSHSLLFDRRPDGHRNPIQLGSDRLWIPRRHLPL